MACDSQGIIGKKGKLPWAYAEELQYFRQITSSHALIMGSKTFKSISSAFLNDCFNIVFSRQSGRRHSLSNVVFVSSFHQFLTFSKFPEDKKYFMIGGAEIVTLFLKQNLIDDFLLTKIKKDYEGDTFFPLHLLQGWPSTPIHQTADFNIHYYVNPQSLQKAV